MPFDIVFAPAGFKANGRLAEGMPMILDGEGAVHEGAAAYFIHRMGWEGATSGTLKLHAYVLKEWLGFLADRKIDWRDGSDALLSDWASGQGSSGVGETRINTKLACVFGFYRTLQEAGEIQDVVEDPLRVPADDAKRTRRFPIGSVCRTTRTGRSGVQRMTIGPKVQYRDPSMIVGRRRYTPNDHEVNDILDRLLSTSAQDEYARVRNHLCAKVMSLTGLRREGTAALSVEALQKGLEVDGIFAGNLRPASSSEREAMQESGWRSWATGLDAIAAMADQQVAILDGLKRLEERHIRNIHVAVIEKGRKQRVVPVPIGLMRSILVEWVWDHRRRYIDERRRAQPSYRPPSELWISRKTGRGMTPAAIANEIKHAFNEAGVDASAHRLRAYFLSNLVHDLYVAAKAAHGRMFDARTILDQAAEIAGHSDPSTLKPYLTAAMKRETFRRGQVVHVDHEADATLVQRIVSALESGDEGTSGTTRRMLEMLAERVGPS